MTLLFLLICFSGLAVAVWSLKDPICFGIKLRFRHSLNVKDSEKGLEFKKRRSLVPEDVTKCG